MPRPRDRSLADIGVRVERVGSDGAYTRISCISGATGGPAFVLVPGIGMGVGIFERLAPRLLAHGDVYALDLPGFAGIRTAAPALTVADHARLVADALDHLALVAPVVIGHSMGTQIVTELAADRALDRIVLISPVVAPDQRSVPRVAAAFVRSSLREPIGVALLAAVSYLLTGTRSFLASLPRMLAYRPERRIPEVSGRVLIIRGQWDAVAPRAWAARLTELAPDAALVEIPRAAHSVMHRNAERVARLLVDGMDAPTVATRHPAADFGDGWTPRLRAYALVARIREVVAILRGDDGALARAKTSRMRAAVCAGEADPQG